MDRDELTLLKLASKIVLPAYNPNNDKECLELDKYFYKYLSTQRFTLDECTHAATLYNSLDSLKGEEIFEACLHIYRNIYIYSDNEGMSRSVMGRVFLNMSRVSAQRKGLLIVPSALSFLEIKKNEDYIAIKDVIVIASLIKGLYPRLVYDAAVSIVTSVSSTDPQVQATANIIYRFWIMYNMALKLSSIIRIDFDNYIEYDANIYDIKHPSGISGAVFRKDNYEILDFIGSGQYGEIRLAEIDGKMFAMKTQKLPGGNPSARSSSLLELSILSTYRHPNIVNIDMFSVDVVKGTTVLRIFMPIASQSLDQLINSSYDEDEWYDAIVMGNRYNTNSIVSPEQKLKIGMQICEGLRYLHANSVLHLDVKPSNVLMFSDGAKLADFGHSIVLSEIVPFGKRKMLPSLGTPLYMSPEQLLQEKVEYTFAEDVWALGCTLVELEIGIVLVNYTEKTAKKIKQNPMIYYTDPLYAVAELIFFIFTAPDEGEYPGITKLRSSKVVYEGHLKWLENIQFTHRKIIEACLRVKHKRLPVKDLMEYY